MPALASATTARAPATPASTPSPASGAADSGSAPASSRVSTLLVRTPLGRKFKDSEGRWVTLPDEISDDEFYKTQTEVKAAEQRLGKGPPPKPVPPVKKDGGKKEQKKEKPPVGRKARPGPAGKGGAAAGDKTKGQNELQESLKRNIPKKIEDVDNFKRDQKAQHMGADVMQVVTGDKNAVVSTFADMGQTPPPASPEHTPEALPPMEGA